MSLADDMHEAEATANQRQLCKTGSWLATLDTRDRDAFGAFLAAGKPLAHLHLLAIRNGLTAGETRFRKHCRGQCGCGVGKFAA